MAYQENSSVASINQLLSQLKTFLLAAGWTLNQETNIGATPSLSISKGGSFVTLSYALVSGDGRLTIKTEPAYNTAPSSSVYCNDLHGAFNTTWFFSDAAKNYCHVVVTKGLGEYSHFSFGRLDNTGYTTPQVTYGSGSRLDIPIVPVSWFDGYGHICFCSNVSFSIPDDVLNESYAPNGIVATTEVEQMFHTDRIDTSSFPYTGLGGTFRLLDYVVDLVNLPNTAGVHLHSIPFFVTLNTFTHHLGIAPDARLCSIADVQEGEEINNSGTIWKIFPARKRGNRASLIAGASMHSANMGLAYKKT